MRAKCERNAAGYAYDHTRKHNKKTASLTTLWHISLLIADSCQFAPMRADSCQCADPITRRGLVLSLLQ